MAKTYLDIASWTPQESWRTIRSFRAAPPIEVAKIIRNRVRAEQFHVGLEQSEQLFRAATAVGYEARPLLLYYGLAQAGQALAAGSAHLSGDDWKVNSHGLKLEFADANSNKTTFWDLITRIQRGTSDRFSRASIALGSPIDHGQVQLGAVVANLQEFVTEFGDFDAYPKVISLTDSGGARGFSSNSLPDMVEFSIRGWPDETVDDQFLASVPALFKYAYSRDSNGVPRRDHNGHVVVQVPRSDLEFIDGAAKLRGRQKYRGREILVRKLGDSHDATHPLMVWWILLYSLSMLARYDAPRWSNVLNIRESAIASQLEYLNDRALDAIPHLLVEALVGLNGGE